MGPPRGWGQGENEHRLAPPYASRQFTRFLERHNVAVLDVVRGAAPDTRRLLVGDPETGIVSYAVAVAHVTSDVNPIDNEQTVLQEPGVDLRPGILRTMPRVVERVDVFTTLNGLVVTGVPGLRVAGRKRPSMKTRELLSAMPAWLLAVWDDSCGPLLPVDLGAEALSAMLGRHERALRLEPALDAIRRARHRLGEYEMPQALSHGCLCPRHVMTDGGSVIGVDDWGMATKASSPLRDLGRFAVRVADARLPEVLAGKTSYAAAMRQFVSAVLDHTPVPRQLWREVLVLAQLELAMESLERADPNGMVLLSRAVRALSGALMRTR
jgi:hypothetical protein